jgi:8-oxo-dGTP pyrophosphatase MutT (NUDIX family)
MIPKWETIAKKEILNLHIFQVELIKRRHPIWNRESEFVVLNSKNWVNVVPITINNEILLIEQYRQGIDTLTIEIPGGLIEDNEEPIQAAQRECIEETGYFSHNELIPIGFNYPNPAFLNNKCFSYAWFGLEKQYEQNLDLNEEIRIIPTAVSEVKEMIKDGRINHSIILTAFFQFFLKFSF